MSRGEWASTACLIIQPAYINKASLATGDPSHGNQFNYTGIDNESIKIHELLCLHPLSTDGRVNILLP